MQRCFYHSVTLWDISQNLGDGKMSKYERFARLVKIMTLIGTRRNLNRERLAELCEVSVRTMQRDINTLCYAGVPIFWSSDRGYGIMPDFFLPPVNLSLEEAFCLVIAAETFSKYKGGSHRGAIQSAISKIVLGLPDETRHRLDAALDTARPGGKELGQLPDETNEHAPESFPILAGDIAHDFSNILTAILGNISLAKMCTNPGKTFERLTAAEEAFMQAKALTQRLLTISRGGYDGHITAESRVEVRETPYDYLDYLPDFPEIVPIRGEEVKDKDGVDNGKILVMDDEKYVLGITCDMLSSIGYKVTPTVNGTEAIELYKEAKGSGQPYDAVILDLIIPNGMGGKEVIKKLRKVEPKVKAIVSSGYSNDPVIAEFRKYGFQGAIAKPYGARELSEVLRGVMVGISALTT